MTPARGGAVVDFVTDDRAEGNPLQLGEAAGVLGRERWDGGEDDLFIPPHSATGLLDSDKDPGIAKDHGPVVLVQDFGAMGEDEEGGPKLGDEHGHDDGLAGAWAAPRRFGCCRWRSP